MSKSALANLPEWDLTDLYPSRTSPELMEDLETAARDAKAFAAQYKGTLTGLDGQGLYLAIAKFEEIGELEGRIMSYAYLVYAGNMSDPEIGKFFQTMQEKISAIGTDLLFFTLELNRIEEDRLQSMYEGSSLKKYEPWLRNVRALKPYQLSDEIEKLLHEKDISGRSAWVRLFDETIAGLKFEVDGEEMASQQVLHLLSSPNGDIRKKAAKSLGKVFGQNVRLFSLITNTLAKDKAIEDEWRGSPEPAAMRHLANQVEAEVVDALSEAVQAAYPRLSHRYYAIKAKWMGQEKIDYWDRNAPLPDADERVIPWDEARDTVLEAYGRFSPELSKLGQQFFEKPWIDAAVRPGKSPGAFAHPTVPSVHPYLLLNYQGNIRDVMTLAHELGHGVHQLLAAPQGGLLADTPLTLAETASVFGEQLTFRALLEKEADPDKRRIMLAGKVEDMLNTVVRQIAFYDFEKRLHSARKDEELSPDQIGKIWMEVQSESLGPAIRLHDEYQYFWSYIPHFIHSPFYVYAYAFGDCLVNALYAIYQEAESGFQDKYFAMLKAGGTLRHKELLAPFNLDASDPAFWSKGLGVIEGFIDELEAL
ncbi:M3 family oligoendopeptidase [Sneathiella chungangensis]|uniref:M3 family oligoendopeptidase n=1 Tax=Sneathiella chungangensis TaxID=1418234 RepID=A0A845ME31_9PROT|nr:M3 family oligoendopeptidase [Sneathiella chungangensis]MZR22228.1 M3 family oligoendopeptidase [Sneathiella chungangensis]